MSERKSAAPTSALKLRGESMKKTHFCGVILRGGLLCGDAQQQSSSHHPVCDENIGLVRVRVVSVRCPDDLLSIGAEHRKTVESGRRCHLLETGSIGINQEKIEVS